MPTALNLVGNTFGRLLVMARSNTVNSKIYWSCQCNCGKNVTVCGDSLRAGKTKSCGCLNSENRKTNLLTHGKSYTSEHRTWGAIKERCTNPNHVSFDAYGGKGITICERWVNSFENFYQDMGDKPSSLHTIDRIENDKGYSKDNCRWATRLEQARNLSSNRQLVYRGETINLSALAERSGLNEATIRYRLDKLGYSVEEAIEKPSRYTTPRSRVKVV